MFDIIIKNGLIIDGSGTKGYRADIGINEDKIRSIGDLSKQEAMEFIQADGHVVTPGFIDMHSHVDQDIFKNASSFNKLEQGITSDIAGNCGITLFPIPPSKFDLVKQNMGFILNDEKTVEMCKKFDSFKSYSEEINNLKIGTNMAVYIGHCLVRTAVMGIENREASRLEMEAMKDYVREAMENGALGMSAGLIYAPGVFADKFELTQLCKVVAEYNKVFAVHMRNESSLIRESIKEIIDIARDSGVRTVISHLKIAGENNWIYTNEVLKMINTANEEGLNIAFDQYPYDQAGTMLKMMIPPIFHAMGNEALLAFIKTEKGRNEIKEYVLSFETGWENFYYSAGFKNTLITTASNFQEVQGKTIYEYATEKGIDEFDAFFEILIKDNLETFVAFLMMSEDGIESFLSAEHGMIGTDGGVILDGVGFHPRCVGSMPRLLKKYVLEKEVITLERAIHKLTHKAAGFMNIKNKGLIKVGYDADIVVMNLAELSDRASFHNPREKNVGIEYVLVNGKVVVKKNMFTGTLNGKLILT